MPDSAQAVRHRVNCDAHWSALGDAMIISHKGLSAQMLPSETDLPDSLT
jgi:hypothetical protein